MNIFGFPRILGGALGIGASPSGVVIYVNSAAANDNASGLSPALPKRTLDGARTALNALGGVGTIRVTSTEALPVEGFVDFSSGRITIEGVNNAQWHCQRMQSLAVGVGSWTNAGSGIYSRTGLSANGALWYVTTLLDSDGFQTRLTENTGTPTTPAAGEFGFSGGTFYVHLPGDVDPNLHNLRRPSTNYLIRVSGSARLTVNNIVARYSNSIIFEVTSGTAALTLNDCLVQYPLSSGINNASGASGSIITCNRVTAQRGNNDGFNANSGSWILNECDGSYNGDEGASPHNSAVMSIYGGRLHHNGHSGCHAVNSSQMNLYGALVDFNGATGTGLSERGGINYAGTSTGICQDCITRDNTGEGFNCQSSGDVTVTNLTSEDNTIPDVPCT